MGSSEFQICVPGMRIETVHSKQSSPAMFRIDFYHENSIKVLKSAALYKYTRCDCSIRVYESINCCGISKLFTLPRDVTTDNLGKVRFSNAKIPKKKDCAKLDDRQ